MARKSTKAQRSEKSATQSIPAPLSEQIAGLAHALWQERGCPDGSPEEDWFRAEDAIKRQRKDELLTVLQDARQTGTQA